MKKQWKFGRKMRGSGYRKRSAKTSKTMLPCRRGAFLPKLASFKKIHENDGKTVPKGTSKIMFFGAKWRHGPPRFDLSSDY
jgi:hypothetical protein